MLRGKKKACAREIAQTKEVVSKKAVHLLLRFFQPGDNSVIWPIDL